MLEKIIETAEFLRTNGIERPDAGIIRTDWEDFQQRSKTG
jgi:hypothetical protein